MARHVQHPTGSSPPETGRGGMGWGRNSRARDISKIRQKRATRVRKMLARLEKLTVTGTTASDSTWQG